MGHYRKNVQTEKPDIAPAPRLSIFDQNILKSFEKDNKKKEKEMLKKQMVKDNIRFQKWTEKEEKRLKKQIKKQFFKVLNEQILNMKLGYPIKK